MLCPKGGVRITLESLINVQLKSSIATKDKFPRLSHQHDFFINSREPLFGCGSIMSISVCFNNVARANDTLRQQLAGEKKSKAITRMHRNSLPEYNLQIFFQKRLLGRGNNLVFLQILVCFLFFRNILMKRKKIICKTRDFSI